MALRIIRKSASQTQVELVRGSVPADQIPPMSLLLYIDSPASLQHWVTLLAQTEGWLYQSCEIVMMKAFHFNENLRPHLGARYWNCKLLQEPENTSPSKRMRMLIQEAQGEICLYAEDPLHDLNPWAEASYQHLVTQTNCAAVGPVLIDTAGQVLMAGLSLARQDSQHTLSTTNHQKTYSLSQNHLLALGEGWPGEALLSWITDPVPVTALPLSGLALRRSAYLELAWEDQAWLQLAQAVELGLQFHRAQYWVELFPLAVTLPESSHLDTRVDLPAPALEKWLPLCAEDWSTVYGHWGFSVSADGHDYLRKPAVISLEQQLAHYLHQEVSTS